MLGLIMALNFCERINKFYEELSKKEDDVSGEFNEDGEENILMYNLMYMSQNSPGNERKDGFPFILLLFEIIHNTLHLL